MIALDSRGHKLVRDRIYLVNGKHRIRVNVSLKDGTVHSYSAGRFTAEDTFVRCFGLLVNVPWPVNRHGNYPRMGERLQNNYEIMYISNNEQLPLGHRLPKNMSSQEATRLVGLIAATREYSSR